MRLSLWFLGHELFAIDLSGDDQAEDNPEADLSGGTTYSTPIGFTPSPGDQRWESGVDYH